MASSASSPGGGGFQFGSIEQLLLGLRSAENEVRAAAEATYTGGLKSSPQGVLLQLMATAGGSSDVVARNFAAVLLRRNFSVRGKVWERLPKDTQEHLKGGLLQAIAKEPEARVVHALCHAVAELCATILAAPGWPEILPAVVQLGKSDKAPHRRAACFLFGKIAEYCGDVLATHALEGKAFLEPALTTDKDVEVRVQAMKACISLLVQIKDATHTAEFQKLIPAMLKVLEWTVQNDDLLARSSLESFIDIVFLKPQFIRPMIDPAAHAMLVIAQHEGLDAEVRRMGLEFIVVIAEKAGTMLRKRAKIVESTLPIALSIIVEGTDDDDWATGVYNSNTYTGDDEDDMTMFAFEALDKVASYVGGQLVVPIVMRLLGPMLVDSSWIKRRAALVCLGVVCEGCVQHLRPHLKELVGKVLPMFNDPHPRVRYAAIHTIGQFATDFGPRQTVATGKGKAKKLKKVPNFQDQYGAHVLGHICTAMGATNAACPRIRGLAAVTVVNFAHMEQCTLKSLGNVGNLLNALSSVITECRNSEQQQALAAVSAVAQVLNDKFMPYYDTFVVAAMKLVDQLTAQTAASTSHADILDTIMLRNVTMETIAIIGEAVGRDKFAADGIRLLEGMLKLMNNKVDDDTTSGYLVKSVCRISKVLGEAFEPYLPRVIPALVQQAALKVKVEFALSPDELASMDESLTQMDVHVQGMGRQTMGIDSGAMETKAHALQMLHQYLSAMRTQAMLPFIDSIAEVVTGHIRFGYHEEIRHASLCSLHSILRIALEDAANPGHAQKLLAPMLEPLVTSVQREVPDLMVLASEAFSESLRLCYESGSPPLAMVPLDHVEATMHGICLAMQYSVERRKERRAHLQADEDADDIAVEQLERSENDEDELMTSLVDAMGFVIKSYKEKIVPVFDKHVHGVLSPWLAASSMPAAQACALCLYDDMIEHCGTAAHKYLSQVMPSFMATIDHGVHPEVCQASVYGCGVVAQLGPAQMNAGMPAIAQKLVKFVSHEEAYTEDHVNCTENAVSSLLKIYRFRAAAMGTQASGLLEFVLARLPLTNDAIEARAVHRDLMTMAATGDEGLFGGAAFAKLDRVLKLFADIVGTHIRTMQEVAESGMDVSFDDYALLDDECLSSLPQLLHSMQERATAARFTASVQRLGGEVQEVLQAMAQGQVPSICAKAMGEAGEGGSA